MKTFFENLYPPLLPAVRMLASGILLGNAMISPAVTAQRHHEVFAAERAVDAPRILWSGIVVPGSTATRMERDGSRTWLRDLMGVSVELGIDSESAALCRDARGAAALLVVSRNAAAAIWVSQDGQQTPLTLPAMAASRPVAPVNAEECRFALATVDGTLLSISAAGVTGSAAVLTPVRDRTELGGGFALATLENGATVASFAGQTIVLQPDGQHVMLQVGLVAPLVAARSGAWGLDARGAIHFVRTGELRDPTSDAEDIVAAPGLGPSTTGLLAATLAGRACLVWATTDGVVLAYDGNTQYELARIDGSFRNPLLVVDPSGDATLQILASAEDGSALLIDTREDPGAPAPEPLAPDASLNLQVQRVSLGARSGGQLSIVATALETPARLAMAAGGKCRLVSFAAIGPAGPFAEGCTPVVGETITNGVSIPQQSGLAEPADEPQAAPPVVRAAGCSVHGPRSAGVLSMALVLGALAWMARRS